jgi:hypothetical protein
MTNESASLTYLEKLYEALQLLHKELLAANPGRIMTLVQEVNLLLTPAARKEMLPTKIESREQKALLTKKIMSLLDSNRAMCEKGLETVYQFVRVLKNPVAYDHKGRLDSATCPAEMNISA